VYRSLLPVSLLVKESFLGEILVATSVKQMEPKGIMGIRGHHLSGQELSIKECMKSGESM
jgi:hypothetical protein